MARNRKSSRARRSPATLRSTRRSGPRRQNVPTALAPPSSPREAEPVSGEVFNTLKLLFDAVVEGLLAINPHTTERARHWLNSVLAEYEVRALEDLKKGIEWAVETLRTPRLPDLRYTRILQEDQRLVARATVLRRRLKPIFQVHRESAKRNAAAAPIIAQVLGRAVRPDQLPAESSLAAFCDQLLGTTSVTLSRARRRWAERVIAPQVGRVLHLFDLMIACAKVEAPQKVAELSALRDEVKQLRISTRRVPRSR